jgi:hypothetical protein
LTSVDGVDFTEAWERREVRTFADLEIPVLARVDLIAALSLASDRKTGRGLLYFSSTHSTRAVATNQHEAPQRTRCRRRRHEWQLLSRESRLSHPSLERWRCAANAP